MFTFLDFNLFSEVAYRQIERQKKNNFSNKDKGLDKEGAKILLAFLFARVSVLNFKFQ